MENVMYYHASWEKLPKGFELKPMHRFKALSGDMSSSEIRVEGIFEKVRRDEFSHRPSRLNCVFATPKPRTWITREHNHGVYCNGNTFITDMGIYSEAVSGIDGGRDLDFVEDMARNYWEAQGELYKPEVLLDGEVIVTGMLN